MSKIKRRKKLKNNRQFVPVFFKTDPEANRIVTLLPVRYKDVCVPSNYMSDGLTKLLNKYRPNCLRAAVVHDFICETECLSRKTGDKYFYEILRLDGVSKFTARKYWLAVRAYAIVTFKK